MGPKTCCDHLGNEYRSVSEMCRQYNICRTVFNCRIKNGWTLEKALTAPPVRNQKKEKPVRERKVVYDHLGNEYSSVFRMCQHYGVDRQTYKIRINKGWTMEKALTAAPYTGPRIHKRVTDHLGNEYDTTLEMCRTYGIRTGTFSSRLKRGWSLEDALTKPASYSSDRPHKEKAASRPKPVKEKVASRPKPVKEKPAPQPRYVFDHQGNRYNSVKEMREAYGISKSLYKSRRNRKWPLERILTGPLRARKNECVDHLGNSYSTVKEMCEHYNIAVSTYTTRIKRGLSVEEALTNHIRQKREPQKGWRDHLGNEYPTQQALCDAYGVKRKTFTDRIDSGWTLEEALTKQRHSVGDRCSDHLGNQYPSFTAMCRAYGIRKNTAARRLKLGWTLEDALTREVGPNGSILTESR